MGGGSVPHIKSVTTGDVYISRDDECGFTLGLEELAPQRTDADL